jgi:hypothetical protein
MTRMHCENCDRPDRAAGLAYRPALPGDATCRLCGCPLRSSSENTDRSRISVRAVRSVIRSRRRGANGAALGPRE